MCTICFRVADRNCTADLRLCFFAEEKESKKRGVGIVLMTRLYLIYFYSNSFFGRYNINVRSQMSPCARIS